MMSENKQEENIVVDNNGKEIKPKKLGFFKKVWYSITKFEKYVEMSSEGVGRALKYLLQITMIFVFIIGAMSVYTANISLNNFTRNIQENLPDFKYAEGQLTLETTEENKVYTIQDTDLSFGEIIIDLNTEDENIIAEYENTIKNDNESNNIGILILKDKVIQVVKVAEDINAESTISMTYDEAMQSLFGSTDVEFTKSDLIQYLNGDGRTSVLIVNFFSYFIAYFIIYMSSGLIYALVLGLIGYTSAKITKIKLSFGQVFSMSIYAFTLSNILNMIYFVANYFTGITIKYFDIAYIAISYVYLVAVLFLIKTDFLKKQENQVKEDKKEEKEETDGQEQI